MKHRELQLLVSSYIDDQITGEEQKTVIAHLETCAECRRFVEEAKQIRTEIRGLGHVELPYAFAERVAHSVEKRDERAAEWLGVEPLARNTFIVLAAIVLLLFVFTKSDNTGLTVQPDQLLGGMASDSLATHVLLKQSELTRSDLIYAVLAK